MEEEVKVEIFKKYIYISKYNYLVNSQEPAIFKCKVDTVPKCSTKISY